MHPIDPWARRELAIVLCNKRDFDEATVQVDRAAEVEPNVPLIAQIRGKIAEGRGDLAEAKEQFRAAIRMSAANVIVMPTPTAGPLYATITGFRLR